MAKVLLTGSSGAIGTALSEGLPALGHEVVGLDLPGQGAALSVDCTDPVAVDEAVGDVRPDAVIHLAGIPTESSLPDALSSHVLSTGALLEAMRRHGVPRIVYASSNHAVGRAPRSVLLGADTHARPDTYYGVGKVAAEALLHLYVDRYGIDAISTRIGSFLERPTTRRQLSTWLSPADTLRMFDAALTAPSPGLRGDLRDLRELPWLVGPRTRPRTGLRPPGRLRDVRRRAGGRAGDGPRPRPGCPCGRTLRDRRVRPSTLRLT